MTDTHDIDSSESAHAVATARADDAPEQSAADAGGEDRPRRGLRRGPRSLIARRRAAAKSKHSD
ncbi:23S rRNA pseudouridylate synthase B, partial [Burkholderia pseudomallei]|nr:23S rRNA pseudouridylate synthase B [Burkholderia pseudomallei]